MYGKCFVPRISTSKNLIKEIGSVNAMLPVEELALNKCLLGEMKYIHKTKSLKAHYTITWSRTKLSKKILDLNNNDNNKNDTDSLLIIKFCWNY